MKSLHLLFSVNAVVAAAAVLLAVLFTFYIYRRTNPIVPNTVRFTLATLRVLSVILLLAVCFEAAVRLVYEKRQRPVLAVAIDHSASMNVEDASGHRAEAVISLLRKPIFRDLKKSYDLTWYLFEDRPRAVSEQAIDSPAFTGDETNISRALQEIGAHADRRRLSGILLISDGAYTGGGNPVRTAEELQLPIFAVGVGSPLLLPDAAVVKVDCPPFAYIGKPILVHVSLHSSGLEAFTSQLTLVHEGKAVAVRVVDFPPSPVDIQTTIEYMPVSLGRQKLEIRLAAHSREKVTANNTKTFYLDVLKAKVKVMLISGSITPDLTFLRKGIDAERYDVEWIGRRDKTGEFYRPFPSEAELDQVDLFILYDFPTRDTAPAAQRLLVSLNSRPRPLLILLGESLSPSDLRRFSDFLPFDVLDPMPRPQQVFAELSPLGVSHPAVQLTDDPIAGRKTWSVLPPLTAYWRIRPLSNSEALVYRKSSMLEVSTEPLILVRKGEKFKSAAISAVQLWRWELYAGARSDRIAALKPLINALISWLEMPATQDRITVRLGKSTYSYGETVQIEAAILDERLRPVENAKVLMRAESASGESLEQQAEFIGEGRYQTIWNDLPSGDYRLAVFASVGDRVLGQASTLFSIGEYSAELAQPGAQLEILKELARVSGGAYAPADSVDQLLQRFSPTPIRTLHTSEKRLWNQPIVLPLILLLLFIEWFIRRRKGMV